MKRLFTGFGLAFMLSFVTTAPLIHAEKKERNPAPKPVYIKSDVMEVDRKEHKITFTGKVMAQQADIQIYAERLTAIYGRSGEEIVSIQAEGSAKIIEKDRVATCGKIFFDNVNRVMTLLDEPRVWEGDDLLEGEEILYYVDEERFVVRRASASIRSRAWKDESEKN